MRGLSSTVKPRRLRQAVLRLLSDRRGTTAVEYGLIAVLIVVAMIASFQALASTTVGMWGNVNSKIGNATGY